MSTEEHDWCWDHLVPYMAGALGVDECARIEAHVAECQGCTREFKDLSTLTSSMWDLFTDARPSEDLEERVIEALRASPNARPVSKVARVGLSIAALFFIGTVGFLFAEINDRPGNNVFAKLEGGLGGYQRSAPPPSPASEIVSADELANRRVSKLGLHDQPYSASEVVPRASRRRANQAATGFAGEALKAEGKLVELERRLEEQGTTRGYYSYNAAPALSAKKLDRAENRSSEGLYFDPNAPAGSGGGRSGAVLGGRRAMSVFGGGRADQDEKRKQPAKRPASAPKPEAKPKGVSAAAKDAQAEPPPQEPKPIERKIIRNGTMEFEVEGFDPAVARIEAIAKEEKGFVATVDSEKLPNGKTRGSVVVRVPPENLDRLVEKLRALGDLRRRRIASQDVTKQYTDLDSRLRAARTMEKRLLKIIEEGKGEVKDLVAAEKELGEWRTRIETAEGEIRYYNNMISLSTLTITLQEKEIQAPSEVHVTEQVTMGVEVENVEESHKAALAAIKDAKGRITKSELKQYQAGQLQAVVNFEVVPDASGALRDLLKQLGVVARFDVQQLQQAQGGRGRPLEPKVVQKDTKFYLSLYNVMNITPRESVHADVACLDAEASYKALLARVAEVGGRVIKSDLNRQKNDQTTGTIDFEVKVADAEALLQDVKAAGEVMSLKVVEADLRRQVTRSKRGFKVKLVSLGSVRPRETTNLTLAVRSVPVAYRALLEEVRKAKGRVLNAQLNENDRRSVNAVLKFDVRREHEQAIADALDAAGSVYSRSSVRAQEAQDVVDSKVGMNLTLVDKENIQPREIVNLAVTVKDVEAAVSAVEKLAAENNGRVVDASHNRPADGRNRSRMTVQVPLKSGPGATDSIRGLGEVRVYDASRNEQVPEGDLATVRLVVTLSSEVMLPADAGPMANIRKGLQISLQAGSFGLMLVMIGLCLVLPIGAAGWGGWKLYRKINPRTGA